MKLKYFYPLLTLMVPNIVISAIMFVVDEPPKPTQLAGYVVFNVFVCLHYAMGIKVVLNDKTPPA